MAHPDSALRRVAYRGVVDEICIRHQCQIAVSATLRNVEHAPRLVVELGAEPLTKGRAAGAQVNSHVKHSAASTARELDLRMRCPLIMHSPQCARRHAVSRIDLGDS